MFTITLPAGPTILALPGITLHATRSREVAYLTRELMDAYLAGKISISPEPETLTLTSGFLTDDTGGDNFGQVIPEVTDFASANSALSTLADNQNRMVLDMLNLLDEAHELSDQLLDVQSAL